MANQEQLKILKQGFEVWNRWREKNRVEKIDLSGANLSKAELGGVDLSGVNLSGADLSLSNLSGANLNIAILREALLKEAILTDAKLTMTNLWGTNLAEARLADTNFGEAIMGGTILVDIDLRKTIGLDTIKHAFASYIGTRTLFLSEGGIPEVFLRGCGLSNWEIEAAKLYNPELTNDERSEILYKIHDIQAKQPIQISPLFISYSHTDSNYVDRLEKSLNQKGIRFWRDKHDIKAGRIEKQIDHAIRQNPTVLLILSENSIQSDWVEHEVRLARKLEKDADKDILCPVALDDSWKSSPWPERIMEQIMEYNVLDFSEWEDDEKFEKMFVKLIDGLNLYYKK